MNLSGIDLNLLVSFDAIYRTKNLTKAGETLGISQPAVSNALHRLRILFEDPLFVRTSQGMQPTPLAEKLAEPIGNILIQLTFVLQREKDFRPEKCNRTFWLSMTDYSESILLPQLMELLSKEAPKVKIMVFHSSREERHKLMESGKLDLAIFSHYPNNSEGHGKFNIQFKSTTDLFQQKLFDENEMCIARKTHPIIRNTITLQQFLECAHIDFTAHQGISEMGVVDKVLQEKKYKRKIVLQVSNSKTVAEVISKTDLIGVMVERLARSLASFRSLQVLPIPFEMPKLEMTQYWHARNHNDPGHRWLRNLIRNIAKEC